jgi:hypothetical protein
MSIFKKSDSIYQNTIKLNMDYEYAGRTCHYILLKQKESSNDIIVMTADGDGICYVTNGKELRSILNALLNREMS